MSPEADEEDLDAIYDILRSFIMHEMNLLRFQAVKEAL